MIPTVIREEEWKDQFADESLDLIISNMNLHWVNGLEKAFDDMSDTLVPDGVFMASALGGDTL